MTIQPVLMGIDPTTKSCVIVAVNNTENSEEIRANGLICVPTSREKARELIFQIVEDIYEAAK